MFKGNKSTSLKSEVSKSAKLSNIQGGLPPLMRGLPVLAILAGEAVAKATEGRNVVEERMLGADDAIQLAAPRQQSNDTTTRINKTRPGVSMMCHVCAEGRVSALRMGALVCQPNNGKYDLSVLEWRRTAL